MRFVWVAVAMLAGCGNASSTVHAPSSDAADAAASASSAAISNPNTNPSRTPAVATPPIVVTQIASAGDATCARLADATVQCWGDNSLNVVSPEVRGAMEDQGIRLPIAIADLPRAAKVVVDEAQACALLEDGTVRCWGTDDGALGTGSPLPPGPPPSTDKPMEVLHLRGVVDLVGHRHLCAMLADGSVTCWHDYDSGSGDPRDAGSRVPVVVLGFAHAVQIADGADVACARFATGKVKCWRDVSPGLIPRGKVRIDPVDIPGISDAVSIAAGEGGACAITKDKKVKCWGQVPFVHPYPQAFNRPTPYLIAGLSDVSAIAVGNDLACAVVQSGDVLCDKEDFSHPHVPTKVSGVSNAVEVVVGSDHACARTSAGTVFCWGEGGKGQLGDGSKDTRAEAAPVVFDKH